MYFNSHQQPVEIATMPPAKRRNKKTKSNIDWLNEGRERVVKWDQVATPERSAKCGGVAVTLAPDPASPRLFVGVLRARCECWLDRYRIKGLLADAEYKAGIKFRSAWLATIYGLRTMQAATVHEWIDNGKAMSLEDRISYVTQAERIVREALPALSVAQKLAVIAVCGQDEALGDTYRVQTLGRGLGVLAALWRGTLDDDVKNLLD